MVIAIPVVHGQQIEIGHIELAAALGADCTMDAERFSAVVFIFFNVTPHLF